MRAVIEEIRLDDHGGAVGQPRDEYAPLVAIAKARGGSWSGWADSSRRDPPQTEWSVASVEIFGTQGLVELLRTVGVA